jgi:hypothetical protein
VIADPGNLEERRLSRVGELLRRSERAPSPEADAHARGRFLAATMEASPPRRGRLWPALAISSSAALLTVGAWLLWPRTVVDYAVEGAVVHEAEFIQAGADGARLAFEDGSTLTLGANTRGRLSERRTRGVTFVLEAGSLTADIEHDGEPADYVVAAGPYRVHVVGTSFDLAWSPSEETASLWMKTGTVVVTGPQLAEGVTVRAGQRIALTPGEAHVTSSASGATTTTPAPIVGSAARGPETAASTRAPEAPVRAPSWPERVASGEYESVLAEVDARGAESVLASASAVDLMSVADAARYAGRAALGRDALEAVRSRYGGSRHAAAAAFLLGRMAEDAGRSGEASKLYEQASSGPFASEALGRRVALARSTDPARARALAELYLAQHPRGSYADLAKSILAQ